MPNLNHNYFYPNLISHQFKTKNFSLFFSSNVCIALCNVSSTFIYKTTSPPFFFNRSKYYNFKIQFLKFTITVVFTINSPNELNSSKTRAFTDTFSLLDDLSHVTLVTRNHSQVFNQSQPFIRYSSSRY